MESKALITIGETTIEYMTCGEGPPVVLIPGGALDVSYFAPLAQTLAHAGYQSISVNPRGAGGSSGPFTNLTLDVLSADVMGVIESLGCAPVHVLGHAFGGLLARCLAADHPELVRSVVLLAGRGRSQAPVEVRAKTSFWYNSEATEAQCIEALGAMLADASNAVTLWQQVKRFPLAAAAQRSASQATQRDDWQGAPGQMPYLLVQGSEDPITSSSYAYSLCEQHGERISVAEVPRAGHFVVIEQPQAVADAVLRFLRQVS